MAEEKKLTGYPSIDKPWLKYYSEEALDAPIPEMSIYEWIKTHNSDNLQSIAIRYFGYEMTYGTLFQQIEEAAAAFTALGVKANDIVTLALPNIPENVVCIYALNRIGAIANLVDLRCQGEDLIRYYNEVNTAYAVVSDMFLSNTLAVAERTTLKKLIVASPFDHLPFPVRAFMKHKYRVRGEAGISMLSWGDFITSGAGQPVPEAAVKAGDTACIMHTSGTTGESKGVMLSNHCFNAMTVEFKYGYGFYEPGDVFMNQVPPFLAYSAIIAIHIPLSLQLCMRMLPDYRPDQFARNMVKHRANHVAAGPADWGNFLSDSKAVRNKDLSFMKTLGSGSDTMRIEDKRAVNKLFEEHGCRSRITEGYGMTEVGSAACMNLPHCDVEGSVGVPLPKMSFCVWDNEADTEAPYNTKGEICMSGPTLMNGYYHRPEETAAVLRRHEDGNLWMHSGDLGYIDENGCIFLDGRLKRIIIQFNGMKVNPFEIEKTLLTDEGVAECCVVGTPDLQHSSGSLPVAFVVPAGESESHEALEARLRALCDAELLERYRPVRYCFTGSLPLTPNGKVDYRALEESAKEA